MIQKINLQYSASRGAPSELRQSMQICVTSNLGDFSDLWPRSDNLSTARCFAFQCADILEVWADTIGVARNSKNLFVAVLHDDFPVMLLGLGIEHHHGTRILTFLDGGVFDYNVPILYPTARGLDLEIVRIIWKELLRVLPPFDIAVFEKMPAEVSGISNPLMKLGAEKYSSSGYLTSIVGDWEEFAQNRLPNKQDSRRQRRKLSERGEVVFAIANTQTEYEEMLVAMIRQKSRKYLETRGVDGFERPGYRRYFTEMTQRLASHGSVHLSSLKVNNEIIAAHWGLIVDKRFYFLMPSYERRWNRFSPGRLLMEDLIQWCFMHAIDFFDLGIGDEPYKMKLHDKEISLYQCVLPVTIRGSVYAIILRTARAIKATRTWIMFRSLISSWRVRKAFLLSRQ